MENDDTFKLTLRQWLVRMIDGQVIPGLEWLQPPQRTYFKYILSQALMFH